MEGLVTQPDGNVLTGRRFGRYELLLELGRGGMATIYLARLLGPENFQKLVVIKKIHDHLAEEREFLDMFYDEARIAGLVHHPNVVSIFEFGAVGGAHFIAMEYVHGQSFVELMRIAKRMTGLLPWQHVVRIVADAAAGLHAAHELRSPEGKPLNVVHRDVSPQNILLAYDGAVKVTDFGIAYAAERIAHTSTGVLKGKLAYMSPEQAKAKPLDRRSDIFSLGIVLYEALCLKRLFKGDNDAATLYRLLEMEVPRPSLERPDLPRSLDGIVLKALERDPDRRFSTAGEFEAALNRVLVEEGLVVTHAEVAELMEFYFREERLRREAQIQQALSQPPSHPVRVYSETEVSAGSLRTRRGPLDAPARSKVGYWVLFALVAVGAVTAGLLLFLLPKGRGRTRSGGASAAAVALARDARAPRARDAGVRAVGLKKEPDASFTKVRLTVVVRPKGIKGVVVRWGNQRRRGSRVTFEMPRNEKVVLEVSARGYEPQKVVYYTYKPSDIIEVELRRIRPAPGRMARPGRRPTRPRPRTPSEKLKPIYF